MIRAILVTLTLTLPAMAEARQVCVTVTTGGPDAWGATTCTAIDRPRGLPARLR